MKASVLNVSLIYFLFLGNLIIAQQINNQEQIRTKKNWVTSDILATSESVCYNSKSMELYVSCINGTPLDKDGKGFIAKLSLTGDITILKWIDGLDAPKGMGIHANFLYVTDIDRVIKINIDEEKIEKQFTIKGAKFLNDITVDHEGSIYITDMLTNKIHRIRNEVIKPFYQNDLIVNPNGLAFENGNLLIGAQDGIFSLEAKDKELKHLVKNTGKIDGLEPDGLGNYIISDWNGKVQLVNPDKYPILLLNTTDIGINAADIVYIKEKELLLVPTFNDNRVMAYYLFYN